MANDATDTSRSLGFFEAPKAFANELEMLKLYQAFSAELLRIALLGLTALAAIIFAVMKDKSVSLPGHSSSFILVAAPLFGSAAAAALAHRYCSSDNVALHLEALRYELRNRDKYDRKFLEDDRKARKRMFRYAEWSLRVGALTLGLGAIAFAVGISLALLA